MSVLLIDADGDLWFTEQEQLGVQYISMPYTYNGETYYYDLGKNTDLHEFYEAMRNGAVSTTQALNPEEYKEILTPIFERGEDVLYVSFGHEMSGTFGHLETAYNELKSIYPERKITVFDTKSICMGSGIQMLAAAKMKNAGASDDEIIAFLNDFTNRVAMYFVVDDLVYLKRGGRLSAIAAFAGTVLGLKPVLTTDENGKLNSVEKIPGTKKALRSIADKVIKTLAETEYSVYVMDADNKECGDELARLIAEARPDAKIVRQQIGPVIGSHCGPGTFGVIFIADQRPIPLKK